MDAHELEKFYYMLMEKTGSDKESDSEDQKTQTGQEEDTDE